jgi:transcriptional regulator with XRE-family HTH domain
MSERADPSGAGEYRLRTWDEFKAQLPQHVQDKINAKFKVTMARLRLGDIREAVGKTQVELAAELGLGQGSVSKIESAADMYLSTLRRYVEALGGELEVLARFPEGTVVPIASLATPKRAARKRAVKGRTSGAKKKPAARQSAPTRSRKQASRKR